MYYKIKVCSITNAQRAVRLLRSRGYKASLSRIENPSDNDGCGYVVKLNANAEEAVSFLKISGIEVLGVDGL